MQVIIVTIDLHHYKQAQAFEIYDIYLYGTILDI